MQLKRLRLSSFRNYNEREFIFTPGINTIKGKNGTGKTNLLEALYLLSTGRSFRTTKLEELIKYGKKHFFIEATFDKDKIEHTLSIGYNGKERKILHNGSKIDTFSSLLGHLPSVLHAPCDIALVAGMPLTRRRFLNIHLSQVSPAYLAHLTRYTKALRQRNALLKEGITTSIEIWENEMVTSATEIYKGRREALEHFSEMITPIAGNISGNRETFTLRYNPCPSDNFAEFLESFREKDLILGTTSRGPHRDEFTISMEKTRAKSFSSEGQKHSFVAAMKIAEWDRLRQLRDVPPLFLLDDFGAHMDPERRERFQIEVEKLPQVILTSPESINEL
jgi:DNA replication and repair protein RecF